MRYFYWKNIWTPVYNNDTGGNEQNKETGNNGGGTEQNKETPNPENEKPKFSQNQLNTLLAEENRKAKKQRDDLIKQYEELKQAAGLTQKQRDELQIKIDELTTASMTKEQLAEQEKQKTITAHKKQVEELSTDRDTWKGHYTKYRIENSLLEEAVKSEAYNPQQIVNLLRGDTRLSEATDADGNVIPNVFNVRVKLDGRDKSGNPITLDLSVAEALKQMKDRPEEFGNLFKSGVSGGLGGNNDKGSKPVDFSKMNHEQYMANRHKLGLGPKKD